MTIGRTNVELREYVRACRRRWPWLLLPVLAAIGIAAGVSLAGAPAYQSTTVLFVTTGASDPDAKASRLNSYIALLTGPRVADSVKSQLNLPLSRKQVQDSITAQVQDGTDLLEVSATGSSAERSRAMVAAATSALVSLTRELDPPSTTTTDAPQPSITIAQDPITTRQPSNLVRNLGFSAALGLLVGAAAVALREATRKTVTDEDDLRRLGLGTVGVISLGGRAGRAGLGSPDAALAEAFRRLRSMLPDVSGSASDGGRGTSFLLTGSNREEGTTAVACGLAIAMAETGAKVALVDANLRSPGVSRYLALDTTPGLADVLAGAIDVPEVLRDSLDGRLTVLPAGHHPVDPGEMLASPALGETVRELTEQFDVVLVDSPPLHAVADAAVLSKVTDSALLVVRAGRTSVADVQRSADLLERVGATLAGAVLNALPRKLPTGPAWNRGEQIAGLPRGGEPAGTPDEETGVDARGRAAVPTSLTARGRAQVINGTIAADQDEPGDGEPDQAGGSRPSARGQARVVIITDAHPPADGTGTAAPSVPAQRDPEERQPGE
ncbi:MAG TPA: polysaccharide biosynthesis tyrosine autokinase [Actinoplanes sp.]